MTALSFHLESLPPWFPPCQRLQEAALSSGGGSGLESRLGQHSHLWLDNPHVSFPPILQGGWPGPSSFLGVESISQSPALSVAKPWGRGTEPGVDCAKSEGRIGMRGWGPGEAGALRSPATKQPPSLMTPHPSGRNVDSRSGYSSLPFPWGHRDSRLRAVIRWPCLGTVQTLK